MALPEQLPHFQERDAFARPAVAEGWRAESPRGEERARWSCPDCTKRLSQA